jgi:hypothetical protein
VIVQDRSQCLKRMSTTPAVGMLAGMTMTNPSAAGPRIIAFRLPYRSAPGLAEGKSLRAIYSEAGMPGRATVFRWIACHKKFREEYILVRELRAEDYRRGND